MNLYDAMTPVGRNALALLLGFDVDHMSSRALIGFRLHLKDISAPDGSFTLGEALALYCQHVAKQA